MRPAVPALRLARRARARERALDRGVPRGRRAAWPSSAPRGHAHRRRGVPAPRPPRDRPRASRDAGIRVVDADRRARASRPSARRRCKDAGLDGLGVSIDGAAHDPRPAARQPRQPRARRCARSTTPATPGLIVTANTQINRLNVHHLRETARRAPRARRRRPGRSSSPCRWAAPPTTPSGSSSPGTSSRSIDTLAASSARRMRRTHGRGAPFNVFAGQQHRLLRPARADPALAPAAAPRRTGRAAARASTCIGIESDGTVKGCPRCRPRPTPAATCASMSLEDIWEHAPSSRFTRDRTTDELWGFCRTCYYADVCRAGCSWTAHTHARQARQQPVLLPPRRRSSRSRASASASCQVSARRNEPYDFGRFEIVEEPL